MTDSDITAAAMPDLEWSGGQALESLRTLYLRAEGQALGMIGWYLREKGSKSRFSRALRALAILLAVGGGVTPLVNAAAPDVVAAQWGYVLLALAAGCVAFDRFFGFSSSWIRYMTTQFALQLLLAEFQHDWSAHVARLSGSAPTPDHLDAMLALIRSFSLGVVQLVEDETAAWASDLSEQIAGLERTTDRR